MKKKFLAALAVVCLLLSGTASVIPFTDVPPDAWYANTVSAACASGIMQGRSLAGGVLGAAPPSVPPAGGRGATPPCASLLCIVQ